MTAAAVALGLVIGVTMGALGGGGSILAVPALVFVLGLSAQDATTASLVIIGVTALVGSVGHARRGNTRWRSGLLLAAVGVPASLLGTAANRRVDADVLLLAFAVLMLVAAGGMLVRARAASAPAAPAPGAEEPSTPATPRPGDDGRAQADPGVGAGGRLGSAVRLGTAGLGIGLLTGFLGVGGGFIVVPVLVVLLRTPMGAAVGTSLLVIALNSAVALAARAGEGAFDWATIVPFTVAAVVGSIVGGRVGDRISADRLTVAFAGLLVAVGVYVAVQAVLGLT